MVKQSGAEPEYILREGAGLRLSLPFCTKINARFSLAFFFSPDDVQSIVSGKLALRYSGRHVEAMKDIAQASQKRSLADFQKVPRKVLTIERASNPTASRSTTGRFLPAESPPRKNNYFGLSPTLHRH